MQILTVRLPEALAKRLEEESLKRGISKSEIVRQTLAAAPAPAGMHPIADILDKIDKLTFDGPRRNAGRDKKRLREIIRGKRNGARHYHS